VTYPPQQPGPYGPQQPPPGGYHAQPGAGYQQPGYQQPGYPRQPPPGYPQQGYPQGGPGFPGSPGGQPPRRSNPAPWILGGVGALVVVVVLVGGFAWPGWFHSGSSSSASTSTGSPGGTGGGGGSSGGGSGSGDLPGGHDSGVGVGSSDELFQTVGQDATKHDEAAIKALACPNAAFDGLDQFVTATAVTMAGSVTHNGTTGAVAELRVQTPTGAELYGVGTTSQLTGKWCVASITDGGAAPN
jgi:hypothetical protein